jgi:hypothetical protein
MAEATNTINPREHRVLVCGGRTYGDRRSVYTCLDGMIPKPTTIIHGGAHGADMLAHDWAVCHQIPRRVFMADWENQGRAAGPLRNARMLREGQPHLVLAFPGGRGTANMIRQAKDAGVPVIEVGK